MRKRSKYRPRPVIRDTLTYLIKGGQPMGHEEIDKVMLEALSAMHALTHGRGTFADWEIVRNMINSSVAMCQLFFDSAYLDDLKEAMVAHARCGRRHIEGKGFGYSGPEIQAVHLALEIAKEQLRLATIRDIGSALAMVDNCQIRGDYYASAVQGRGLVEV